MQQIIDSCFVMFNRKEKILDLVLTIVASKNLFNPKQKQRDLISGLASLAIW
jgi:hypothetical protein